MARTPTKLQRLASLEMRLLAQARPLLQPLKSLALLEHPTSTALVSATRTLCSLAPV